jgi:cobalt/nickel transport system permease protein
MHIPDGFLNAATMTGTGIAAAGGLANAVRITGKTIGEKQVPLMGVMAAFVFAAQMLNFPVAGGTSGHLIGAALCAILLGPWASVLIISLVLIAQCLIFQDGGLLSLGANILNMAIIGGLCSYYIYRGLQKILGYKQHSNVISAFAAAWVSVVLASLACALELAISGTAPVLVVVPAMTTVHAIIGIGEGLATVAVLALVQSARPDLLKMEKI